MEKRMSAANTPTGGVGDATGVAAGYDWAPREHAPQPARALGPKAGPRQARRRQREPDTTSPGPCAAAGTARDADRFQTADAAITFVLRASGSALSIERIQRRPIGTHLVQFLVFDSAADLLRWSEAEPLRLDDPGLHQRLVRRALEYFHG